MEFNKFKNKYIFTGELKVETAFHIGSGDSSGEKDAPCIKYDNGEYYIPGSSFRGYLRTRLERFLTAENGFKFTYNGKSLNEADIMLIFGYTNLKDFSQEVKDRIKSFFPGESEENISSLAGRIHISDMIAIKEKDVSPAEITRDGIRIDRETGTVADKAKFDYNVLPAGTKFKVEISCDNIEDYQLQLLNLAMTDIKRGDIFGGKVSRGIGKCILKLDKCEYVKADNKEQLKEYLFKGKMKEENGKEKVENILKKDLIKLA